VFASVPSPRRVAVLKGARRPVDYPPNHFLRWTPSALEELFLGLGYRSVHVELPPPPGSDVMPGASTVLRRIVRRRPVGDARPATAEAPATASGSSRLAATAAVLGARAYQRAANVAGYPVARRWSARGASASSMLVIASP
jgi:hypothetical protein